MSGHPSGAPVARLHERFGAVLDGLMLGESLSWTGLFDRSRLLPPWTRRKRREIEVRYEQDNLLETSLPFALNQPTAPFHLAPGPNSEWVAFQLRVLAAGNGHYQREAALEAWQSLTHQRPSLRLTVGQDAVVDNLSCGKLPPISGHDNPHYFDDSACFRAIALLLAVDQDLGEIVALDAAISNAEDGVWAAQAYAAALQAALATGNAEIAVRAAEERLPAGSWISNEVARALDTSSRSYGLFEVIFRLADEFSNHAYNYGNTAPETVALTLAIINRTEGSVNESLLAALSLPRYAGSLPAMVGALCGALTSEPALPEGRGVLAGIAIPSLRGTEPRALLDELARMTR